MVYVPVPIQLIFQPFVYIKMSTQGRFGTTASVHKGWSVPSSFGVSVRMYVESKAPALQAVKPTRVSEFSLMKASCSLKLQKKIHDT